MRYDTADNRENKKYNYTVEDWEYTCNINKKCLLFSGYYF